MAYNPTSFDIIKNIPVNKSPGQYLIINFIVKNLLHKVIVYLMHLFNALFRLSYFLSVWIYSINKPPKNPALYQPISLSPYYLKNLLKKAPSLTQFGVRGHYSSIHQLHRTVDNILIFIHIIYVGLMICCNDEYLKSDAMQYFSEFTKLIVHISICHFSNIPYGYSLKINPYILMDAITVILSHEREAIFNFSVQAIELIMKELNIILGNSVCIGYSTPKILL